MRYSPDYLGSMLHHMKKKCIELFPDLFELMIMSYGLGYFQFWRSDGIGQLLLDVGKKLNPDKPSIYLHKYKSHWVLKELHGESSIDNGKKRFFFFWGGGTKCSFHLDLKTKYILKECFGASNCHQNPIKVGTLYFNWETIPP